MATDLQVTEQGRIEFGPGTLSCVLLAYLELLDPSKRSKWLPKDRDCEIQIFDHGESVVWKVRSADNLAHILRRDFGINTSIEDHDGKTFITAMIDYRNMDVGGLMERLINATEYWRETKQKQTRVQRLNDNTSQIQR